MLTNPLINQVPIYNLAKHHGSGLQVAPNHSTYLDALHREMANCSRAMMACRQSGNHADIPGWKQDMDNLRAEIDNSQKQLPM